MIALVGTVLVASVTGGPTIGIAAPLATGVPSPDHVVVVMEENHAYSQIIGNAQAPYINGLAAQGALFTNSHAIEHPSQPNYLDLFSGSNQGVSSDTCPYTFVNVANLGSELLDASLTFVGYSEDLPAPGSQVCTSGAYARKHSPWVNFTNVPAESNLPFTYFPTDYSTLLTLSFVIPNLNDDMHNGTIAQGDTWLQQNLDAYKQWAMSNNSLLIVTWDEDDSGHGNQIATIFVGPMVVPGQYGEAINHFNVLRTMEDMYGLPHAGQSAQANPITDVWVGSARTPTPTPTDGAEYTATSTATRTATPSRTSTLTPSTTATFTDTATPTATQSPTSTATSTATSSPTFTFTATDTPTQVPSPTAIDTPVPSATACVISFRDVPPGSTFYPFVRCLACLDIIGGYSDGTFHPSNNVTRGQLSKIVSNAAGFNDAPGGQLFEDVAPGSTFYDYVNRLASRGIISGYPCGGPTEPCGPQNLPYFLPANHATRGQISKIVADAAGLGMPPGSRLFEDVPPGSTFYTVVQRLANADAISGYPCGEAGEPCMPPANLPYFRPSSDATRGQTSKIVSSIFFPDCNLPRVSRENENEDGDIDIDEIPFAWVYLVLPPVLPIESP